MNETDLGPNARFLSIIIVPLQCRPTAFNCHVIMSWIEARAVPRISRWEGGVNALEGGGAKTVKTLKFEKGGSA